jgi:peptidyl-prolyl cis-trans isomerase C
MTDSTMTFRPRIFAAALLCLSAAGAFGAQPESDPVIAESARARLTLADYDAELAKLPAASRNEFAVSQTRLRQYLDNLYVARALAADARAEGVDKDPLLSRQIAMAVDKLLAQAQVERIEAAAAAAFDKSEEKYAARAREMYDVSRSRYAVAERVKAAHILVMVGKGDKAAARAKAEAIRARLAAGADFAKVARETSDDPSVAMNGGELGWFEAKQMDPEFAAAAFAMTTKGEVSAPVLSSFGYHLILFEDRRPAGFRSFDEVKPELMAELKTKAVAEAKTESTRRIFSDPTLKVDVELIDRINVDAVAKANAAKAAAPGKP